MENLVVKCFWFNHFSCSKFHTFNIFIESCILVSTRFWEKKIQKYEEIPSVPTWPISTSNHRFGRAIWDKLPNCSFENFEIIFVLLALLGQFQNFQNTLGQFIQNHPPKHVISSNNTQCETWEIFSSPK